MDSTEYLLTIGEISHQFLNLKYLTRDVNHSLTGLEIQFMVDTGAGVSIINYPTYVNLLLFNPNIKLKPATKRLRAANEHYIEILGIII